MLLKSSTAIRVKPTKINMDWIRRVTVILCCGLINREGIFSLVPLGKFCLQNLLCVMNPLKRRGVKPLHNCIEIYTSLHLATLPISHGSMRNLGISFTKEMERKTPHLSMCSCHPWSYFLSIHNQVWRTFIFSNARSSYSFYMNEFLVIVVALFSISLKEEAL